jgi:DNA gyrase/topoisomerase IV subunit A
MIDVLTNFFDSDSSEQTQQEEVPTLNNSKINKYPLSALAMNEWKDYAMYTIESRAIPNMIDGMKPVNRFYLYSSIKNSRKEFKKVSAVSGVVSGYGYNHGETSAAAAGQLMAAEWANNICLVQGRGSFGTRLVNDAAAARYTYTKLHDNFEKYIKDIDLAPIHDDPEHEPPAFYVPTIPLVLVNGIKGIGTGFATNILPRDPADVANACNEYINTGKIKNKVKLKFPDFRGTVSYDPELGKYVCRGIFERKSKTVVLITEVPYGYDREAYIKILDVLEDKGLIVSYDDLCDKDGFKFEVKLKQTVSSAWEDEQIVSHFKLEKTFSENLTVIDHTGKLREYSDERDLIKDFCDFRYSILQKRIDLRQQEFTEEARWANVKMQFVKSVLDDIIKFKGNKKDAVVKQIVAATEATEQDCDRLLRLNIMTLTDEMVRQLKADIAEIVKTLKFWKGTNVKDQALNDLQLLQGGVRK